MLVLIGIILPHHTIIIFTEDTSPSVLGSVRSPQVVQWIFLLFVLTSLKEDHSILKTALQSKP